MQLHIFSVKQIYDQDHLGPKKQLTTLPVPGEEIDMSKDIDVPPKSPKPKVPEKTPNKFINTTWEYGASIEHKKI
jgi:hypothetical protein